VWWPLCAATPSVIVCCFGAKQQRQGTTGGFKRGRGTQGANAEDAGVGLHVVVASVHCGWHRPSQFGSRVARRCLPELSEKFSLLAYVEATPIWDCMMRSRP